MFNFVFALLCIVAAFSRFLCLLGEVVTIYFTANGRRKLVDGSIPTIFPQKEQKKERENETPAQVFSCEFCEILKNTFVLEHLG